MWKDMDSVKIKYKTSVKKFRGKYHSQVREADEKIILK
jgi:hypothetical protein